MVFTFKIILEAFHRIVTFAIALNRNLFYVAILDKKVRLCWKIQLMKRIKSCHATVLKGCFEKNKMQLIRIRDHRKHMLFFLRFPVTFSSPPPPPKKIIADYP